MFPNLPYVLRNIPGDLVPSSQYHTIIVRFIVDHLVYFAVSAGTIQISYKGLMKELLDKSVLSEITFHCGSYCNDMSAKMIISYFIF